MPMQLVAGSAKHSLIIPPEQNRPMRPMHSAGAGGHEQLAPGNGPMHGFPAGQVVRCTMVTQPLPSRRQARATVVDSQETPWPVSHPPGGALQAQAATGSAP